MSILIFDEDARERLQELKQYAEKNVWSLDELFDIKNGDLKPPGLMPEFQCTLQMAHKVVFAIEQQPEGLARHASISVKGKPPSVPTAQLIINELGFINRLERCHVYIEPLEEGGSAVNIVETIYP